ncbi:hypothetical protein FQN53_003651 [Emmonsiellopsis sp. PD_33]|nr:hypothetical protein FQN53_003651 [Emmonsiellopsis sp. PD_33]
MASGLGANNPAISEIDGEKDLLNALAEGDSMTAEISEYLARFRIAAQNAIFQYFETGREAAAPSVEGRLWDMHGKINKQFRDHLSHFRDDRKRPVEKRKLQNHYLTFIKSSQRFYRGFIQHLVSRFDCIPELEKLAKELKFETLAGEEKPEISESLRKSVLLSCHANLIRLGDLSRYREMELVPPTKSRNWDPAVGYYKLADTLNPDSGVSHNQLAIIALADGNHLQATYHLYRALSAQEPHQAAKGNLELEFKKIIRAWEKGKLIPSCKDEKATLISLFIYLHARCYKGVDFPEREELENEILRQIAVDLKGASLDPHLLQKFCLINIAAEAYANSRKENGTDTRDAPVIFQSLNIKTFLTLLQILLAELESSAATANESEKITSAAQSVLPPLRHYSSWLISNSTSLVSQSPGSSVYVQISAFLKMYTKTLNILTSSFDAPNLPDVNYLLYEDEDALSFSPLMNAITAAKYVDDRGQKTARASDVEKKFPVDVEMLYRVREFIIHGLQLVTQEKIPVVLSTINDSSVFIYKEEGLSQFSDPNAQHQHAADNEGIVSHPTEPNHESTEPSNSQSASASIFFEMNQMVDNLVESEPTESCPPIERTRSSSSAWHNANLNPNNGISQNTNRPDHGFPTFSSYSPTIEPLAPQQSYSPRPALPSILNTPFAPQPGESISPGTRPSTARQTDQFSMGMNSSNNSVYPPDLSPHYMAFQNNLQPPSTPHDYITSPTQIPSPGLPYGGAGGYGAGRPFIQPPPGLAFGYPHYNDWGQPSSPYSYQYSSNPAPTGSNSQSSKGPQRLGVGVIGQTPPSGQGG